jgi:hypothetical protein
MLFLNVRDQVSHHTKHLAELCFTFLDSRREDRRLLTEW